MASRVASLPDLVQRVNDFRAVTGGGLAFLHIPRTYYGLLTRAALEEAGGAGAEADHGTATGPGLTRRQAEGVLEALAAARLMDDAGAVRTRSAEVGLGGKGAQDARCPKHTLANVKFVCVYAYVDLLHIDGCIFLRHRTPLSRVCVTSGVAQVRRARRWHDPAECAPVDGPRRQ